MGPSGTGYMMIIFIVICVSWLPKPIYANDYDNQEKFCPIGASVDLTYATSNDSGFLDETTGHFFNREVTTLRDGVWSGCICDIKPCLALCPADHYAKDSAIPRVFTTNLIPVDEEETLTPGERFHLVIWDPCEGRIAYFPQPEIYKEDEYYLLANGSLFIPRRNATQERLRDFKNYCLKLRGNNSVYSPRICTPKVAESDKFAKVKYFGALVSVPFLIATVVVYSILPELRTIHGTTLRCYLCCLMLTYVALAADRIPPPDFDAGPLCLFLGFTIYFSFLASFLWLNVMCLDMWWRFGGFGSLRSGGKERDRQKFIGYSIYAWGIAVLLTAFCIGMEFTPGIPDSLIRPGFRAKLCWFSTKKAAALYYFGPAGVIIACNICLFISTSIKIAQRSKESQRQLNGGDSKRHANDKQWFSLHLKLSVIMGISWSSEIISWLWKNPRYLWYFTDMVNALQGFLIFIIFVCKKTILKSLKKRYKELRSTPKGHTSTTPSPADSPDSTNCSDDSSAGHYNVAMVMDEIKDPRAQNSTTNL